MEGRAFTEEGVSPIRPYVERHGVNAEPPTGTAPSAEARPSRPGTTMWGLESDPYASSVIVLW